MGTEILRPQDCLTERMRIGSPVFSSRSRRSYAGNYSSNTNNTNTKSFRKQQQQQQTVVRSEQKKRFHPQPHQSNSNSSSSFGDEQQLKPGHVTILKRGESLDVKSRRNEAPPPRKMVGSGRDRDVVCCTERLGPEPKMVPKQIRISDLKLMMSSPSSPPRSSSVVVRCDVYAGSGFAVSPSPSSLPLPSFNKKKEFMSGVVDDSATKDLRRLLRLE